LVKAAYLDGDVTTLVGPVPRVRTSLVASDRRGTIKARLGVGRMQYRVAPGLYAVGEPGASAPVLVTANYKLSFDALRRELSGRHAWLLVLDTKGINVWCAAGKGTFGTDELVQRIAAVGLDQVVRHRTLILPQLGAPGITAHEVKARSGFRVEYGPVRAADLPAYLDNHHQATAAMRRVQFNITDRAIVVPVEVANGLKPALLLAAAFLVLGGLARDGYAVSRMLGTGLFAAGGIMGAFLLGAVVGPLLLPWLPGRAFALKGALLGAAGVAVWIARAGFGVSMGDWLSLSAWGLLVPSITSFVLMNFTGASTFTSLSGVMREMRFAVPLQAVAGILGVGLWVAALLFGAGRSV